jgi:hypothetical protein
VCSVGVDDGYCVQVSYPAEPGSVTVAVYDTRAAARADADVYRGRRNARGVTPKQVRLVSTARITRPDGDGDGETGRYWARTAFTHGATISEIADALSVSWITASRWARSRAEEPVIE